MTEMSPEAKSPEIPDFVTTTLAIYKASWSQLKELLTPEYATNKADADVQQMLQAGAVGEDVSEKIAMIAGQLVNADNHETQYVQDYLRKLVNAATGWYERGGNDE